MAMTKNYYYVNGEMIGYSDENGHKDVLTDALGNITGEVDETGELTYQARYSPLGKTISSSGSSSSGFGWLGAHGYRETGLSGASHYVQSRHYDEAASQWTTVDGLWPEESAYTYVNGMVTSMIDPSGQSACQVGCPPQVLAQCFGICKGIHQEFDNCKYYGMEGRDYVFDCKCKCPKPVVPLDKALDAGVKELNKRRKSKCKRSGNGEVTPAFICPGGQGRHITYQYTCSGKKGVKVSIVCCKCDAKGTETCFYVL